MPYALGIGGETARPERFTAFMPWRHPPSARSSGPHFRLGDRYVESVSDPSPTWWSREHPLLIAAVQAEEGGGDPDRAVNQKAIELGIPIDIRPLVLRRLHDDGYLDVALQTGDDRLLGAHVRKVTPEGVRAASERPPATSTSIVEFVTVTERRVLEVLLLQVRAAVDASDLDGDDLADAEAQLATAETQLRSPRARRRVLRETLQTVRAVTENLVAAAVWVEIVRQLPWLN